LTAVFVHLTGPGMRLRCRAFCGRLLAVLALVLPVPVCAVLGLSLPLPAIVERIAAKLVPFGTGETRSAAEGGTIILAPGEQRSEGSSIQLDGPAVSMKRRAGLPAAATSGPRATSPGAETATGVSAPQGEGRGTTPTNGGPTTSAPNTSSDGVAQAPAPGGTQTGDGSEPAEPSLVDTAETTANGAVDTATTAVTETVSPPADSAKGVVDSVEDAAKGALDAVQP